MWHYLIAASQKRSATAVRSPKNTPASRKPLIIRLTPGCQKDLMGGNINVWLQVFQHKTKNLARWERKLVARQKKNKSDAFPVYQRKFWTQKHYNAPIIKKKFAVAILIIPVSTVNYRHSPNAIKITTQTNTNWKKFCAWILPWRLSRSVTFLLAYALC